MKRRDILAGSGAVVLAGVGATFLGARQMGSMDTYSVAVAATRAALLATVLKPVAEGVVTPEVGATYPLRAAAEAHRALEA